jgi:hypothetical protein
MAASNQIEQLYLQIRDGKVVDKLLETGEITDVDEKTLAEEFKNLPPLSNIGPNVTGVSHSSGTEAKSDAAAEEKAEPKAEKKAKKKSEKKADKE